MLGRGFQECCFLRKLRNSEVIICQKSTLAIFHCVNGGTSNRDCTAKDKISPNITTQTFMILGCVRKSKDFQREKEKDKLINDDESWSWN